MEVLIVPFGNQLKKIRMDAGLSQEALARLAGLSASGIAKLEQGQTGRSGLPCRRWPAPSA
jgi:transcriptional regulator with XRE-family HTH domain